jgi:hypothetical protein
MSWKASMQAITGMTKLNDHKTESQLKTLSNKRLAGKNSPQVEKRD